MSEMKVIIITGEKEVYSDDADVIVAPGIEGDLGILPHHAALITSLRPGQIMIRKNGEVTFLVVSGGFMEIINNRVTILADAVE
jgi:F-type H+-transporting ATPase subunit epsilon